MRSRSGSWVWCRVGLADERFAGSRLVVVIRPGDLAGAAVWGLVRSAQSEHPGRMSAGLVEACGWRCCRRALVSDEPELAVGMGGWWRRGWRGACVRRLGEPLPGGRRHGVGDGWYGWFGCGGGAASGGRAWGAGSAAGGRGGAAARGCGGVGGGVGGGRVRGSRWWRVMWPIGTPLAAVLVRCVDAAAVVHAAGVLDDGVIGVADAGAVGGGVAAEGGCGVASA